MNDIRFRLRTLPIPPHRSRRSRTRRDAGGRRRRLAGRADRRSDPVAIRLKTPLDLPTGQSEYQFLRDLRRVAARNQVFRSFIGLGYYDSITPSVILRNVLENPGWYTPYTPYQAEIAQGRLEALLNFQTMVRDLTGMEIANASLLDEATAAAEAMTMLHRVQAKTIDGVVGPRAVSRRDSCFPQTLDVLKARAEPLGIEIVVMPIEQLADASSSATASSVRSSRPRTKPGACTTCARSSLARNRRACSSPSAPIS